MIIEYITEPAFGKTPAITTKVNLTEKPIVRWRMRYDVGNLPKGVLEIEFAFDEDTIETIHSGIHPPVERILNYPQVFAWLNNHHSGKRLADKQKYQ